MDQQIPHIPTYPYEVLKDHGGYLVMRNTALVAEVIAIKERVARMKLNTEDGLISKPAVPAVRPLAA